MSKIKVSSATIVDLADMAEETRATRFEWGIIRDAVRTGESWALRDGEQLIGVAGLVPIGPAQAEAWFHFRQGASANTIGIVRAIRLTMDASPYRAIVTLCKTSQGSRIARAAGFIFARHSEFGEVWAYGRSDGYAERRRREAPAATDGSAAAHEPGAAGSTTG